MGRSNPSGGPGLQGEVDEELHHVGTKAPASAGRAAGGWVCGCSEASCQQASESLGGTQIQTPEVVPWGVRLEPWGPARPEMHPAIQPRCRVLAAQHHSGLLPTIPWPWGPLLENPIPAAPPSWPPIWTLKVLLCPKQPWRSTRQGSVPPCTEGPTPGHVLGVHLPRTLPGSSGFGKVTVALNGPTSRPIQPEATPWPAASWGSPSTRPTRTHTSSFLPPLRPGQGHGPAPHCEPPVPEPHHPGKGRRAACTQPLSSVSSEVFSAEPRTPPSHLPAGSGVHPPPGASFNLIFCDFSG